jgi:oxygen-independent coproporphyrinogen-3 oxidase
MLGLYVHIPFCSAICNYCNFNRGLFDADLKTRYVEALIAEIRAAAVVGADPRVGPGRTHGSAPTRLAADTIFFGGGTPSLLEPDEVARIIAACGSAFSLAADAEITLEANPETVTEARLAAFRAAGINRVSFGVQSFREEELRRLSRLHSADRARAALAEARAAGFDNISLDLMMWLPEQRVSDWLESVDAAIALGPDHLSLYLLELYPNAPLKDAMARARWSQGPDEDAAAMYLTAMDRLEAAGYPQYEISNVSRPGRRSRHNLKYWTDGEWLGFGCGAHSSGAYQLFECHAQHASDVDRPAATTERLVPNRDGYTDSYTGNRSGVRWKNVSSTEEYVARVSRGETTAVDVHRLTPDERLGDALFTGLRLAEGIDLDAIETRYGVDIWRRYGADLEPFLEQGCLRRQGTRLWLTRPGMLIAHEVMTVFV